MRIGILLILIFVLQTSYAQTWVDSVDSYAREAYIPAGKYHWSWTNAALLNTMVKQYELAHADKKQVYLNYIKKAMDKTYNVANGHTPNGLASGLGLAFLYRVTKEEKYKTKAEKIYGQYLKIKRTKDGAVSHLMLFRELWDDTIFMIGEFMLGMYQATGDEKYLEEFMKQFRLHRDKLQNKEYGLWVHGWDSKHWGHCMFCSQPGWAKNETGKSGEIWGRGNGWIVVTLSDALSVVPKNDKRWNELAGYLKEMIVRLPELQDKQTGHWYQLPVRNTDPDNWIESSSTAMFAYGIVNALELGLVTDASYKNSVALAYTGLRRHSVAPVGTKYLTSKNVCVGTCIGSKRYYLKRGQQKGKPYGVGMLVQFGKRYERMKM
ncbi:MAG TPA: glycoside hydrolase family 88 protein [Chitinophagales bacterium]|nr:glycoside hydrolase family 88 protein [Chitinophagales bacterium]